MTAPPSTSKTAAASIVWAASGICLLMPWLNPFASGPSASVVPWLFTAACAAMLAFCWPAGRLSWPLGVALAALAAWAGLRSGVSFEWAALAGGLVLVALCARSASVCRDEPQFARLIAAAWVAAAAASTVIALLQYLGLAHWLGSFASGSASHEAYANLRQRNQFATLTAIGVAALSWQVARSGLRVGGACLAVVLAVGNAATTSRTGLLELVVLAVLAGAWTGPRRSDTVKLVALALCSYFAASLVLPWLQQAAGVEGGASLWVRVSGVETCSSRRTLWANVLHLIGEKPWVGWGWGELDYAHYATLYPGDRFCDIADNAHNLPLHLAAELGLPAALLACGTALWATVRARPWAETDATRRLAWSVLAVLAVHSMLEYPLWYGPFQMALGLALGLLHTARTPAASQAACVRRAMWPALLLVSVAYAAWDYTRVSQIYLEPQERLAAYRDDTLEQVRRSKLFRNQAEFADLTLTPLTRANAQWTHDLALALLHYSPEPKVIEKVIESATLLGRDDEAVWHLARLRAAFPTAYKEWSGRRSSESAGQPAFHSPDFPPRFSSSRTPPITIPRSTALHMS